MTRTGRVVALGCAAAAVAVVAFIYRFNTLGGALGGFENDHFMYLVRTDMLLWGGEPLRDFVDAELRGAWPALSYAASAWAQQLGGRTLLPEAYLTAGALAIGYAIVFVLAFDLSKRWSVALLATGAAIATAPKLYNYPKILMLALAVWAIRGAVGAPTFRRLAAAGAVTAAATLFRNDYGIYIGAATVAALATASGGFRNIARAVAIYAAATCVLLLPSAIWVQMYGGIPSYVRDALASVAAETARTGLRLPRFEWSAPFSGDSLLVVTYYVFWAIPAVAGAALLWRLIAPRERRLGARDRAMAIGLLVMTILVNLYFLRANLAERFGDAVVPAVLLCAWMAGAASLWSTPAARTVVTAVPLVILLFVCAAAYQFADIARELDTSGLSDSWGKIARRYEAVRTELRALPPETWSGHDASVPDPAGVLGMARYVAECTEPRDHVLVTGSIHEVAVFARRPFAGGQAIFKSSLYVSDEYQRRAVDRMEKQSVPVVVADARDFDEGFVSDYPVVAQHLQRAYRQAGAVKVDGEPRYLVFVDANRRPAGTDPDFGLPCFR